MSVGFLEPIVELLVWLVEQVTVVVTVMAYLLTSTKCFREVLNRRFILRNRSILIMIFGSISIYGTYAGMEVSGAIANIRDVGPMVAGLVGGPSIGAGAGAIGGVHRYLLGGFTAVPCSISTVLAGLFGGIIYVRKAKFIGVPGSVAFAALMEAFHMVLTLLIARPYSDALMVVEQVSIPMIAANSLGMMIFAFLISNVIGKESHEPPI